MRAHVLVLGLATLGAACSRPSTSSPAPPAPREAQSKAARQPEAPPAEATPDPEPARLLLATSVAGEEAADASAGAGSLAGKTVLHVGDSMVGGNWGLTKALEIKVTQEGAKFVRDYKVSESIVSFDKSTKLKELLAKHNPDVVILTLGTNDAFVPYPEALAPSVKSIAKRMAGRECWWLGPPMWKPDTGIVAVIRDNAGPCKFFDGSNLNLERVSDGIHPTNRGGAEWADRFWTVFRGAGSGSADAGAPVNDRSR
jgi:hypothetical protein